ncbi:MAG: alpha/beta hydrolase [Chitinophagaceae bacterium]|nr:alpha/beta hydrolase [Chitinophagaceae bacterium]
MKTFLLLLISILSFGCTEHIRAIEHRSITNSFAFYSTSVGDSFMISVYIPDTSSVEKATRFPIIYILDANLYFDIYASILKKYSEVGLMPAAILIGVGYSSFEKMDSLRQRDYTFPLALAEYEMPVSGKADQFLNFLQKELVPLIDRKFPSDTSKRILTGHSLGGYFTMYTLQQELKRNNGVFHGFISASPSLHYNNNYLLKQIDSMGNATGREQKLYVAYGDLENAESKSSTTFTIDELFKKLTVGLSQSGGIKVKTATFSEMDHMDTQIPSFIKGAQWVLADK